MFDIVRFVNWRLAFSCWLMAIGQPLSADAQSLTLGHCLEAARQHYPLAKQRALLEKTREYSIENARKGILPQFAIGGQASYQSAVTQVPISLPGIAIPSQERDQYKLYGDVYQSVTDVFTLKDQHEYIRANAEIETQKVKVELYKLKERVHKLYFGILLIDAQIGQAELLKNDIRNGIARTEVAIGNGVALKSTADNLRAELLKAEQRTIELKAARTGYADMLSLFIGRQIDESTTLEKPHPPAFANAINRPELRLFDLQKTAFERHKKLVRNKNLPRFGVFVQGGYGRPGLNMLHPHFEGYYIAGLRMNWNLSGFYTLKNERKMLVINQNAVDVQRETFLFDTDLALKRQHADIGRILKLIETDKNIVSLRESVKTSTQNQLLHGTATTNDYLLAVSAEDLARQNLLLHEIALLMEQYGRQLTVNGE